MNNQIELQNDIKTRHQRIQAQMQKMDVDACILSTGVNIFYTTGVIYTGYFYLPAEGKAIHFVKRPQETDLDNAIPIRKPEQISEELQKRGLPLPLKVLLEIDVTPFSECNRLITSLNIKEVLNASTLLRKIRSIKSDYEIAQVKICARKHEAVYKLIPSLYKRGMTDIELQIDIERQMRLHGSMGIFRAYGENMDIFMGSLLVGKNAEVPTPFDYALGGKGTSLTLPLGACGIKIEDGQTIMVDMAGNYTPWMTDMTRVFSVGEASDLAYKAHQVSIDIENEISQFAKPGFSCAEVYNIAYGLVEKHKLEDYFMGTKQQAKFVGHGVGLEINEMPVFTPRSKEVLEQNVIFALEPKFVIPNIGAVGIENTFAVTSNGVEKLTIFEEDIIEL